MNNTINYYRVTKSDIDNFSKYGDTIAIRTLPDTDAVYNLTTGRSYTYGGEQGTLIKDIENFPLFDTEKANKEAWGL